MFKKTISLLLSAIIVLSLVFSISLIANAASPTLSVSNETAYVGSEVNVIVDISSNSNIAAGNLVLQYDSSKLEVKSASYGSVVGSFNPIVNTNYGNTGNKIKLVIYTGTNNVLTSSGTLLSVVFKAVSTGNAEVKISESRFSDINGNVISTTKSKGSVTISSKPTTSYTLSYNANGGTGAPSSQTGSTSYTISSTKPTRSGYTFLGWSKSSSATSASYSAGGSITLTANTTLYAVWSKNPYTVTLYSGTDKATSKTISTTGSLTFVAPTSVSGWTTLGWRKDTTASTATYSSTGSTTVSANSTFYAVYSKPLSVTFNANGGSGAPSSQSVTRYYNSYGNYSTASLTLSSTKPTRSGYTFLGWSTSSSATSASYSAGGNITLTANTTLYAVWSENQVTTYTLSYNANGGSGAPASQTGATSYAISPVVPTRPGHTFYGWTTDGYITSPTYKYGATITLKQNTVLYAVWIKDYNYYDGNFSVETPSKTTINLGTQLWLYIANDEALPTNSKVVWSISNDNVRLSTVEYDARCYVFSQGNGSVTITAKLVDENGTSYLNSNNEEVSTSIVINSKAGFFQKLVYFFMTLFNIGNEIDPPRVHD